MPFVTMDYPLPSVFVIGLSSGACQQEEAGVPTCPPAPTECHAGALLVPKPPFPPQRRHGALFQPRKAFMRARASRSSPRLRHRRAARSLRHGTEALAQKQGHMRLLQQFARQVARRPAGAGDVRKGVKRRRGTRQRTPLMPFSPATTRSRRFWKLLGSLRSRPSGR